MRAGRRTVVVPSCVCEGMCLSVSTTTSACSEACRQDWQSVVQIVTAHAENELRRASPLHAGSLKQEGISKFWMNFLNITGCVSERLKVSSKI